MYFLNFAWNSTDAKTVINCFNKAGFCRMLSDSIPTANTDESIINSREWQQIAGTDVTFSEYVDCDSCIIVSQQPSLEEILEQHWADEDQEDNDNDNAEQELPPVSRLSTALEAHCATLYMQL